MTKKRQPSEISDIKIVTAPVGYDGWTVDMRYTDNKMAIFNVDRGNLNNLEMIEEVTRCIKLQLKGTDD